MVIDFFFEHAQVRLLPPACSSKLKIAGTVAHRRLFWKLFDGEKEERARPVAEREDGPENRAGKCLFAPPSRRRRPALAPVPCLAGLRGRGRPLGRV